jgi:hypothetical protein
MPDLSTIIREAAAKYNLSPELMLRIAQIESGMNPNSANPNSSARGVYQFLTKPGGSWSQYGRGGNVMDPVANVDAGARYILDNQNALKAKLGRDPADWETYLAHQQGAGGAPALLQNPNRPAAEVLRAFYKNPQTARDAIALNAGNPDAPAQDFANVWKAKYEGTPVPGAGADVAAAGAPAATTTAAGGPALDPSITNPAALAYGPPNMLSSIFGNLIQPLAQKPQDPLVKRTKPSIGASLDNLGAPVHLSSG